MPKVTLGQSFFLQKIQVLSVYKKRVVVQINSSLLLEIILYNT
jgi:hypothetical protein